MKHMKYFINISVLGLHKKTSAERHIRIFSAGGAQIGIYSIGGPVCSISANQEQLFYTYHRGEIEFHILELTHLTCSQLCTVGYLVYDLFWVKKKS